MDIRSNYDHREVAVSADPDQVHAEMRASCPVAHSDRHNGFWALTRYDDVEAALRDPATFSSLPSITLPDVGAPRPFIPMESDPPEHQKYRTLINAVFRPLRIQGFEDRIRETAIDLIEQARGMDEVDLARDLTFPLTARIITWFLGIPESDVPQFCEWSLGLITVASPEEGMALQMEIRDYYVALVAARRIEPSDDLASHLMSSTIDDRPVSDEEIIDIYVSLTGAGGETTAATGNHILRLLDEHVDLRSELIATPANIPTAIEEFIRFITPVHGFARNTTREVEVGGVVIPKGERVWMSWLSANRDESRFPDSGTLKLDRTPNPHLGFGGGPHRCPGSPLARLTLRVFLEEVLTRIPNFRLVDRDAVTIADGVTRVIPSLPAVLDPAV